MATEIKDYDGFLKSLSDELARLKQKGDFSGIVELPDIIESIKGMISPEIFPKVAAYLGIDDILLQKCVDDLFASYFAAEYESFREIRSDTRDFFSFKKAYQLSHARSIWESRIGGIEGTVSDILYYYMGRLFVDYYESLSILLCPVLLHRMRKPNEPTPKLPDFGTERIKLLQDHLAEPLASGIMGLNLLRNDLSHAGVLFEKNQISLWKKSADSGQENPIDRLGKMEFMMNLFVLFTTEFDLRILALAKPENNHIFPLWMEYFEIYVTWFHKNPGTPQP